MKHIAFTLLLPSLPPLSLLEMSEEIIALLWRGFQTLEHKFQGSLYSFWFLKDHVQLYTKYELFSPRPNDIYTNKIFRSQVPTDLIYSQEF